jgi:aspartate/methionine/tyrosine aminotransferase
VLGALVAPGEEVLMLAPRWPLVAGMARVFGAVPVDVPALGVRSPEELVARVEALASERTVALHLNSPNNPSGAVLPRAAVEALVSWAGRRGLWVLADEVFGSLGPPPPGLTAARHRLRAPPRAPGSRAAALHR